MADDRLKVIEEVVDRLCDRVEIHDCNTEINDLYFEVDFLGVTVESYGGSAEEVRKWAQREAKIFKNKIRAASGLKNKKFEDIVVGRR